MTPRTGAGGAAVLLAALFPAACLQTVILQPPQGGGSGGGGGLGSVDGGSLDVSVGGDTSGDRMRSCPASSSTVLKTVRDPVTAMLVVDHSASMMTTPLGSGTRLSVVQGVIQDLLGRYPTRVNFGYVEFPQVQQGRTCSNANNCCVGSVSLPVSGSQDGILAAMGRCATPTQSCLSAADSTATPTGDALKAALNAFNQLTMSGHMGPQKAVLLLTDHEPGCGGMSNDPCEDARFQVANLNSADVVTYLVAVGDDIPASSQDAFGSNTCFNDLALASSKHLPSSPYYYWATTDSLVHDQLFKIVASVACYAQVSDQNFDQRRWTLDIDIDGQPIARDTNGKNGWNFEALSNGQTGIFFYGAACDTFLRVTDGNQDQKLHVNACPR